MISFFRHPTIAIAICLGWKLLAVAGLLAQAPPSPPVPPNPEKAQPNPVEAPAPSSQQKTLEAMRALKVSIAEAEAEIKAKQAEREELDPKLALAEREAIDAEIAKLSAELATYRADLEEIASGIDMDAYKVEQEEAVDLGSEMQDFLRPIINQMKELTSRPREIEKLKNTIAYYTEREKLAEKAIEHIDKTLAAAEDEEVIADLKSIRKSWEQRLDQAKNDQTITQFQLDTKLEEKGTVFHSIREGAASFFRTRGRNLFVAAATFIIVFTGLRFIHRYLHRLSPMRKRGHRSITVRIIDIAYYVFTFVASVGVLLFVLYVTDDWVLLGLVLLFLAGLAWTGKQTLPIFYEQAKLMLNLGSVREGERIIFNGIPWRVEAINIFTDLTNPSLQGGRLRLPLRELTPLLSRPFGPKEPWFPSEEGNWLMLSDGTFGKVIAQTPEWVQLVKLGGSRLTYPTADFVALAPEDLSRNFRVKKVFGVDYQHQAICTTEIPTILQKKIQAELENFVGSENVLNVAVEFSEAGASSLDFEILADFAGAAASKYNKLARIIPRICVDASNENGWVIPFTQVTLHQAASPEPSETP